jgi:hypothetical protein
MIQVGDTLESGRFEVLSKGPGDQYVLRDTWSKRDWEATIREELRSGSAVYTDIFIYWHHEITFMFVKDGRHHIVRMFGDKGVVIAAGGQEAVRAAWRLLMPGCPERHA